MRCSCSATANGSREAELIGPYCVEFFGCAGNQLCLLKHHTRLVSEITGIDERLLRHEAKIADFLICERMSWAARRKTTRPEDRAYSLLGLFDINMPMLYGEGPKAFVRLQEEIVRSSSDQSIFAWDTRLFAQGSGSLFADSPLRFVAGSNIMTNDRVFKSARSYGLTNRGLEMPLMHPKAPVRSSALRRWLHLRPKYRADHKLAVLPLLYRSDPYHLIALRLEDTSAAREKQIAVPRLAMVPTPDLLLSGPVTILRQPQWSSLPRMTLALPAYLGDSVSPSPDYMIGHGRGIHHWSPADAAAEFSVSFLLTRPRHPLLVGIAYNTRAHVVHWEKTNAFKNPVSTAQALERLEMMARAKAKALEHLHSKMAKLLDRADHPWLHHADVQELGGGFVAIVSKTSENGRETLGLRLEETEDIFTSLQLAVRFQIAACLLLGWVLGWLAQHAAKGPTTSRNLPGPDPLDALRG
ncbi:hypothetical protein LTR53_002587 [Teratosphaeriaceae sp. CCFEE 6253]|nr:hypothetical protein LTR53_002587 [Teratosphaeriaceae sp. CCFEE 6253]